MRYFIPLSFLFSMTLPFLAFGETIEADCPSVRMDLPGEAFKKIPVYNQMKFNSDDLSICYAITAAEAIDAHRFYHGDRNLKKLTSPLSLILNSNQNVTPEPKNLRDLLENESFVNSAINRSINREVCDQNFLEQYLPLKGERVSSSDRHNPVSLKSDREFLEYILDQIYKRKQVSSPIQGAAGNSSSDIETAVSTAAQANGINKQLRVFLEKLCSSRTILVQLPKAQTDPGWESPDGISASSASERATNRLNRAHSLLNNQKHPTPVMIGFNADILRNDVQEGFYAHHAAIIIGQRFQGGQCEFLVRDSYGSNCTDDKGNARYAFPCEGGNVWISDLLLMKNTRFLYWIPWD